MVCVKICGVRSVDLAIAAADAGADYIGLNFYPPSPRYVLPSDAADIARTAPPTLRRVGLFVNPADDDVQNVLSTVPLDILQLHGNETPARVTEVRTRFGLPVIKAVAVRTADDITAARDYENLVDFLMFDAKSDSGQWGGTGYAFDWTILRGQRFSVPWFLAGGLRADNVAEAIRITGAKHIDCASGVETRPGEQSAARMREFIAAARSELHGTVNPRN